MRTELGGEAVRVGRVHAIVTVVRDDRVLALVQSPRPNAGNKTLPNAGGIPGVERILVRPPIVEIADDRYLLGIGRPDGEVRPPNAVTLAKMSSQLFIDAAVVPFPQEVEVLVGQKRSCGRYRGPLHSFLREVPFTSVPASCPLFRAQPSTRRGRKGRPRPRTARKPRRGQLPLTAPGT